MEGEEVEEQKTNNKKECLFSFSKLNKYFIIPFLCPVMDLIREILEDSGMVSDDIKNKDFLIDMLDCLSTLAGGLLYFFAFVRTETEETRNNAMNSKKKNKIIGYLIIMSLMISFPYIFWLFQRMISDDNTPILERRIYYYCFLPLFSKFILKSDIFSHQILSLIISYIGMILLSIPIIKVIKEFTINNILFNLLNIEVAFLNSLVFVLIKKLTHKYYLSPYLCQLYLGFFSIIFTFIAYIILSLITKGNISIVADSFNFSDIDNILLFIIFNIGLFLFRILDNILLVLTIYYFTPTLLMITDIIRSMLIWIYLLLIEGKKESFFNIIMTSIGYSIILFGSLIYNEIIICNFFGFNKNTKKCIEERQREELLSLEESENQNNSRNSSDESDKSDNDNKENDNDNKEND